MSLQARIAIKKKGLMFPTKKTKFADGDKVVLQRCKNKNLNGMKADVLFAFLHMGNVAYQLKTEDGNENLFVYDKHLHLQD